MQQRTRTTSRTLAAAAAIALLLSGCDEPAASTAVPDATPSADAPAPASEPATASAQAAAPSSGRSAGSHSDNSRTDAQTADGEDPRAIQAARRTNVEDNPPGWPPIEFEPAEMWIGVVPPRSEGGGTVTIYNVGDKPLRIQRSIPSCSCVKADDLSGRVIPPGESIDFYAGIKLKPGLGEKMQKIVMFFDGYPPVDRQYVQYFVKGEASRPVRLSPPYIDAFSTDPSQAPPLRGELLVESIDGQPFSILAANGRAPEFKNFEPQSDEPRNRYTLIWDLHAEHNAGDVPWFWVIATDHPDAPVVDARIRHDSTKPTRPQGRPWQPLHQRVLIDAFQRGDTIPVTVELDYPDNVTPDLNTIRVESDSRQMLVALRDKAFDGGYVELTIDVTPLATRPGLFVEQFTVHADGFPTPVRVIGTFRNDAAP